MIEIERRSLHPNSVPSRDGLPLNGWVIMYMHGLSGDVAYGHIVDGRLEIERGHIAFRMIAADGGRMRYAAVQAPDAPRIYVLGEATDEEILAAFGIAPEVDAAAAKAEAEAAAKAKAEAAAKAEAEAAAKAEAEAAAKVEAQTATFEDVEAAARERDRVEASIAKARATAAELGITKADITKAPKAELLELFKLLELPCDPTFLVGVLRTALVTALNLDAVVTEAPPAA